MKTADFVDAYNAQLPKSRRGDTDNTFSVVFGALLKGSEKRFDDFVASRAKTRAELKFQTHEFNVYAAVDLGQYTVGKALRPVVVQPTREVTDPWAEPVRVSRNLEIFALDPDELPDATRPYYAKLPYSSREHDELIGKISMDSSRRLPLPSTVGLVAQFDELLDEVMLRAI